uniref:Alpha-1,3-mannosyl-glycoprotein 2-beta-N-acetylglucosaminyltransferase n=1 Tax=Romanomermis culicivorax TaxID=13658 RepID=A0A915J5R2_ROMCU
GEDHDSIDDLQLKIDRVEEVVKNQLEENKKLLRNIQLQNITIDVRSIVTVQPEIDYSKARIAVLVISCNRPNALKNVIDQLLKLRSSVEQFPVIVSQDCFHDESLNVIKNYGSQITHIQHPDNTPITLPPKETKFLGYYKLARHYRWALNKTFYDFGHESVIIVEGERETFWDDWMRHPDQRKNRACIRPEISRTAMSLHGKVGVSKGLYFDKHLKFIKLNDKYVNFSRLDTSYLLKDNYDEPFVKLVYSTTLVDNWNALLALTADDKKLHPKSLRLTYTDQNSFNSLAKSAKIMEDAKAGVPRMAYRGIVTFMYKQTRVYLTPLPGWTQYDVSWT